MKLSLEKIDQIQKNQLTGQELILLKLRSTLTLDEIATLVGCSHQWVSQMIKGAMAKIEAQGGL